MTNADGGHPRDGGGAVRDETLELRARPQPITRINRKVLIGAAAAVLLMISGAVLVALKPPSLRTVGPELITVDRKPITDGLARLPDSYEGLRLDKKSDVRGTKPETFTAPASPLSTFAGDLLGEAERAERARVQRLAGQARESQVFFRLALKPPAHDAPAPEAQPPLARAQGATGSWGNGDGVGLTTLHGSARTLALGDAEAPGADTAEPTRKLAFLKGGPEKEIYNPHRLQRPASPYQLMAGTVIAASLISGLNSDLPGFVIAAVTENVYDTVLGRHLLIPQGARLVGSYDNIVAFGQERALVVWQRIILPDGTSVVIDNLPATDTGGYAGLADGIDLHTWKLLKGVALATVLGVGSQLALGTTSSTGAEGDLIKALQQSVQSSTNRAGQRLVERNLNVQPTITVRPGWPLRVIVHKDIVLRPYRAPVSN